MLALKNDCLANLYQYWQNLVLGLGGKHWHCDGQSLFDSAMQAPIFSQIFNAKLANADDLHYLENLSANFFTHQHYSWWLKSNPNSQLIPHKARYFGTIPVMLAKTKKFKLNLPHPLAIIDSTNSTLQAWEQLFISAWQLSPLEATRYVNALANPQLNWRHYSLINHQSNQVIATATLLLESKLAGLYNLCVSGVYRRRGYATILHKWCLNIANQLGQKYLTLQSTPMGQALALKLGYQEITTFEVYCF